MSSSVTDAEAVDVHVDDSYLTVNLRDGRRVAAPTEWFPRLMSATAQQRSDWRLIGTGSGIHWPQVDEDISVNVLLSGHC